MSETETTEETEEVEAVEDDEGVEERIEETVEEVEETVENGREKVEETVEEQREKVEEAVEDVEETVEETVDEGLEAVDDAVVDVVSAVLDTSARAEVYVALRKLGEADADEVAEETGLYPDKVDAVLDDLEEDGVVETETVGEDVVYTAVSPTELVVNVPGRVVDSVRGFVEGDDDGKRVLEARFSPYRLIIEPKEEEEGEEIPVEA
ncbi:MAG: helix-turn-helix domain-containing protein [Halobacteriales archaeon]